MSNIASSRQLRSTRAFTGLSQKEFAATIGVHERAVRYWEANDALPTSVPSSLQQIDSVLRRHGVIAFYFPSPGVRLATKID
jgi:DNA-binding transcriptional regulator YiaG